MLIVRAIDHEEADHDSEDERRQEGPRDVPPSALRLLREIRRSLEPGEHPDAEQAGEQEGRREVLRRLPLRSSGSR